jgi:hypothetical protein
MCILKKEEEWSKNARKKFSEDPNEGPFPSQNGRGDLLWENPAFPNKGPFRRLNVV